MRVGATAISYGGRLSREVPSAPIYARAVVHAIIQLLSYHLCDEKGVTYVATYR
jgi:hypothetical protein